MNIERKSSTIKGPPVLRLIAGQVGAALLLSGVLLAIDLTTAYSALLGSLVFVIPNAYFAFKSFAFSGARAARQIVNSLYKGEAVKLVLTAVLFTAVFVLVKPLNVLALFGAYMALQMTNWLAPLLLSQRSLRK